MSKKPSSDFASVSAGTKSLLAREEGREVDFKASSNGVKAEDIVALANAGGGTILVGVTEATSPSGGQIGVVTGCSVTETAKRSLMNIGLSCRPPIELAIRRENTSTKKPIFRIDIPEGDLKPYSTASGTYKIRTDGQNLAVDPQLMRAIILQAEADEFVVRFKAAADDLVAQLNAIHADLTRKIEQVESAAADATEAARDAEQAAIDAGLWSQA